MTYLVFAGLLLFGIFFTGAAVLKLSRHQHFIEEFESMKMPYALAYVSGAIEIVCGPALIAGFWFPVAAGIAAAVMFCVMLGAAVTNLLSEGRGVKMAIGVLVIFALPMLLIALYYQETTRTFFGF
ncbi:MAG: DoxX family protein [Halioglobus sp.]|nr:DoxX family protein [Halioglobus sp.]